MAIIVGLSYHGSRCLRNVYSGCHDVTAPQTVYSNMKSTLVTPEP